MSAYDHLPLIDPKEYFDDPSIPDGKDIGFVNPQGIVFRDGVPVGRDKTHSNYALDRLKSVIDSLDQGNVAAIAPASPRQITRLFEGTCLGSPIKVGLDNRGDCWVLEVGRPAWQRLTSANLPPLPQE